MSVVWKAVTSAVFYLNISTRFVLNAWRALKLSKSVAVRILSSCVEECWWRRSRMIEYCRWADESQILHRASCKKVIALPQENFPRHFALFGNTGFTKWNVIRPFTDKNCPGVCVNLRKSFRPFSERGSHGSRAYCWAPVTRTREPRLALPSPIPRLVITHLRMR